jgi:hypothetical protein
MRTVFDYRREDFDGRRSYLQSINALSYGVFLLDVMNYGTVCPWEIVSTLEFFLWDKFHNRLEKGIFPV